ncbi:hypothetical protein U8Q05_07050 [Rhizobium ruizarguesonis]|nr:hypothetical protein U8Q05_07050 [Rhizobium ruizarguesonis]
MSLSTSPPCRTIDLDLDRHNAVQECYHLLGRYSFRIFREAAHIRIEQRYLDAFQRQVAACRRLFHRADRAQRKQAFYSCGKFAYSRRTKIDARLGPTDEIAKHDDQPNEKQARHERREQQSAQQDTAKVAGGLVELEHKRDIAPSSLYRDVEFVVAGAIGLAMRKENALAFFEGCGERGIRLHCSNLRSVRTEHCLTARDVYLELRKAALNGRFHHERHDHLPLRAIRVGGEQRPPFSLRLSIDLARDLRHPTGSKFQMHIAYRLPHGKRRQSDKRGDKEPDDRQHPGPVASLQGKWLLRCIAEARVWRQRMGDIW